MKNNKKELTAIESFEYFKKLQKLILNNYHKSNFIKLYSEYYGIEPSDELINDYCKQTSNVEYEEYNNEESSY